MSTMRHLVNDVFGRRRMQIEKQHHVPRQSKCNKNGEKWEIHAQEINFKQVSDVFGQKTELKKDD